ncbi:MAG: glycosyltransferase [Pseudomonadales bacterium]
MSEPSRFAQPRVLQISHDYLGPFRRVTRQYTHAFTQHHTTTVYLSGEFDSQVVSDTGGDEVIFLARRRRALRGLRIGTLWQLARLFKSNRYDIVVAHRYKPIYLAAILNIFYPVKVLLAVAHEHDVYKRWHRRWFVHLFCRHVIFIGVSESVSGNIEQHCGAPGQQGRLYTLPTGLDAALGDSMFGGDEARLALGIPKDTFCFGTIGRLIAKKDHNVLLSGFARLRTKTTTNIMLVIIGGGPCEEELRNLAAHQGIENQVIFTGNLASAYRYLPALNVFVLSSGPREAFGLVLLEAMLARLPIVCSNAPGPMEVVGDTASVFEAGNATDLAEKLNEILELSGGERLAMAEASANRFHTKFTLDAVSKKLWQLPQLVDTDSV